MNNKVLISGGAGFIGSNIAIKLIKMGFEVTILDNLSPQIMEKILMKTHILLKEYYPLRHILLKELIQNGTIGKEH